jgi:DNA-binding IclR family transcriptional regulator
MSARTGATAHGESAQRKVMAVVEALGDGTSKSLATIAAETGLAKPTVHRILTDLGAYGWVGRTADGRYRVGLRLFEIGSSYQRHSRLHRVALPYLQQLHRDSGASVCLGVIDGKEVVALEYVHRPGLHGRLGARWAMHTSSIGKVVLAYSGAEFVADYCRDGLTAFTEHSITDAHELEQELSRVRSQGYATSVSETFLDVCGLAAGVFDATGQVVATVSVASLGPSCLAWSNAVMDAGRRITAELARIDPGELQYPPAVELLSPDTHPSTVSTATEPVSAVMSRR